MTEQRRRDVATFVRSVLTGAAATVVDLAVLAVAIGLIGLSARAANLPALLAGAVIQFVGSRHYAFDAAHGSLRRQLMWFTLVEVGALALNALGYDLVAQLAPLDALGAVIVRLGVSSIVFVGFSYPLWRRVFKVDHNGRSQNNPSLRAG